MDFHLSNFYKAFQGYDAVQGGMRHGFAVESTSLLDFKEFLNAFQRRLKVKPTDEFNTPILTEGKYYPATTIDVGVTSGDGNITAGKTLIETGNPANDTGILDTIEIYATTNSWHK